MHQLQGMEILKLIVVSLLMQVLLKVGVWFSFVRMEPYKE